jgi:hypothetical protein
LDFTVARLRQKRESIHSRNALFEGTGMWFLLFNVISPIKLCFFLLHLRENTQYVRIPIM